MNKTAEKVKRNQQPPTVAKMPPDTVEALHLLVAMARAFKAIDDRVRPQLAALGLAMTEFAVLEVLYHKGPLQAGEIAERILVTGASTTYTLRKLEARGWMRRRPSDEDGRVVIGELTSSGRKLMDEVFPLHAEHLRQAMSGLSPQEKRSAARLMRKMGRAATTAL